MTTVENLINRIEETFTKENVSCQEWQLLFEEMRSVNRDAAQKGEEAPFPALGYLEMVGMMADPTGYEGENNGKR
ncbi:MAG: hypothetical protein HFE72_10350 [Emergencia sp.]|uniref:hypothetical protein n=1 Tax=Emergencia sp. JLR.KK010 TaxID=3114296 RepID=UPI00216FD8C4|nr:hypothetical protein [Emergencia sp.]